VYTTAPATTSPHTTSVFRWAAPTLGLLGICAGAVLLGALLAAPQATAVCSVPPNQIGITGHWERDARRVSCTAGHAARA
jgi:hypothetical protein